MEQKRSVGKPTEKNGDTVSELTAEKIGQQTGVTGRTVERNADFAKAVDKQPETVKAAILSGQAGVTKRQVIETPPNKLFCDRCERAGPVKGCEKCKALRAEARKPDREPGDDTESEAAARKRDREAMRNNGKPAYDDRIIDKLIGQLTRAFDDRGRAIGDDHGHEGCISAMSGVLKAWKAWKKD